MSSEDEKFFPSDYDEYYYYCRISIVEEAKEKYIKCNGLLLGSGINNSPAMELLANGTDEKKQRIYNKYKKLYQDFIMYSDKLINKDNIDSEDIYIRYMENLMRISNETIVFTYKNFGMQKGKLLRQGLEYNGKNKKLSYVIDQNRNIPYILNPDETIDRFINRYLSVIWIILIAVLICVGYYLTSAGLNEQNILLTVMYFISSLFIVGLVGFLVISGLIHIKKFRLIENESNAHSRSQFLVIHPYKSRFSIKSVMNILKIINDFRH